MTGDTIPLTQRVVSCHRCEQALRNAISSSASSGKHEITTLLRLLALMEEGTLVSSFPS